MKILGPLLACAALAAVTPLSAQSPVQLPGLIIGIGAGGGMMRANCGSCATEGVSGIDREVTAAVALGARFQFGLSIAGWEGGQSGGVERESVILGVARAYPLHHLPLHLAVGIGLGRYRAAADAGSARQVMQADAPAFGFEAGYDLRIGGRLVAVPQLSFRQVRSSMLSLNGAPIVKTGFRTIAIGVALRWRVVPFTPGREPG